MCGEKGLSMFWSLNHSGSPPRMRGKDGLRPDRWPRQGITPAYAGKRMKSGSSWMNWWDHPRVCGEKFNLKEMSKTLLGSPPRMRGKDPFKGACCHLFRITPACAGKSCTCVRCPADRWDHPRACGEKSRYSPMQSMCQGSPPRMRGKGDKTNINRTLAGITPAHAGKRFLESG